MTDTTDWPDFLNAPPFTFDGWREDIVTAPGQVLYETTLATFQHCLVLLESDGDGSSWTVELQFMDAGTSEGGSIVYAQQVTRVWPQWVVVPMTVWAPVLRIVDVESSAYPHNSFGRVSQFSARGFQTGYPGGTRTLFEQQLVAATDSFAFNPIGAAPGLHSVQVATAAADWSLSLRNHLSSTFSVDSLLADETTTQPYNIQFIAPASSWQLIFENNDGGARLTTVIAQRLP